MGGTRVSEEKAALPLGERRTRGGLGGVVAGGEWSAKYLTGRRVDSLRRESLQGTVEW